MGDLLALSILGMTEACVKGYEQELEQTSLDPACFALFFMTRFHRSFGPLTSANDLRYRSLLLSGGGQYRQLASGCHAEKSRSRYALGARAVPPCGGDLPAV